MHTETPWIIEESDNALYIGPPRQNNSKKVSIVFSIIFNGKDDNIKRDDAKLIVEAVNKFTS